MASLDQVLEEFLKNGKTFAREQLVEFVESAKADESEFIQSMGRNVEKYTIKLLTGLITPDEYKDLLSGVVPLKKMQMASLSAQAKVRAEKIARGLEKLTLDAVCKLI